MGTTPVIPPGSSAIIAIEQFQVKLLTASIKVCAGCRGGYERGPPPMDIILVRKERHICYNAINQRQQLSGITNVHYHANTVCPRLKHPLFDPKTIEIPQDVKVKLNPVHLSFLRQTFGVNI